MDNAKEYGKRNSGEGEVRLCEKPVRVLAEKIIVACKPIK
jgi:hypothetical protein